jgi:thermitase
MPLSEHFNDFHISPWSGRSIAIGRAWDLSERLAADRDVASAEPAFRTPGLEPAPEHREDVMASYEITASAIKPEKADLPCARDNPLWSLELAGVDQAWQVPLPPHGKGKRYGARIKVAHPDTGYTKHDEIWSPDPGKRRVLAKQGYDFEDDDTNALDPLDGMFAGHGTGTASVIMSDHNPSPGTTWVSGVAPKSRLIPFRVSDSVIHFDFTNVARAIHEAVEQKAHIISMSLGGPVPSRFLKRAIDRAISNGVIVLAAAGNVLPWVVFPARYESVIAVAAVNCRKKPWSKSAHGSAVDISAPGESVWRAATLTDSPDPYYVGMSSGTSYAVATVAGACALWLAHHGRKRLLKKYGKAHLASVFREVLLTRGFERPSGWKSDRYGAGILRADRLLEAPLPRTPPAFEMGYTTSRAPISPPNDLDRIAEYFPASDRPLLRGALAQWLRVETEELDHVLARHGDEVLFHLATNPQLRGALQGAASARTAASAALRRTTTRNTALRKNISRTLRRRIGLSR